MMKSRVRVAALCLLTFFSTAALAETSKVPIKLSVDLSEAPRRIFHAKMIFPVKPGPFTLVYPKWIPGEHGPTGPISDVTGIHFRAGGKEISWRRDDVDLYAFHCDVPEGASELEATLDYLSPYEGGAQGVPSASAKVAVLPWNLVLLYPAETKSDEVPFAASLRLPTGWKLATALRVVKTSGDETSFEPVSLTTLVDSPVLAGQYFRSYDLSPQKKPEHWLNVAADSAAAAQASEDQIQHLRQLVAETDPLFGARHYKHYDFLLALTDHLDINGLEHHESSDNRAPERTLLEPEILETLMDLLPHEYFHSWNGKFRRPAGLATPNYQEPMKGDLLWVYEGLTQYYGTILAARSGFWSEQQLREYLASITSALNDRPGRTWRDLEDTAISAQILYFARKQGSSWRRPVDYYEESTLIWLEADTIIRRETKRQRSLDDFCKAFHGGGSNGPELKTYTLDDVVSTLNKVAPYDWKKFFEERVHSHGPGAPLAGIENAGWKLTFSEVMNEHQRASEAVNHETDVQFSLGMIIHDPGSDDGDAIEDVVPGSPAAKAGIAADMKLIAVNGRRWTSDTLREAIRDAKNGNEPIELLVENGEYFKNVRLDYHGGERYPHLAPTAGANVLGEIAKQRVPNVQ